MQLRLLSAPLVMGIILALLTGCGVGGYVTLEVVTSSNVDLKQAADRLVETQTVKIKAGKDQELYRLVAPSFKLGPSDQSLNSDFSKLILAKDGSAIFVKLSRDNKNRQRPTYDLQLYRGYLNHLSGDRYLITLAKKERGVVSQVQIPIWWRGNQVKVLRHQRLANPIRSEIENRYSIKLDDATDMARLEFKIGQADFFQLINRILDEGAPSWTEPINFSKQAPRDVFVGAHQKFFNTVLLRRAHYYRDRMDEAELLAQYLRYLDKKDRSEATYLLARLYAQGIGVPQDWAKARFYAGRAIKFGLEKAKEIDGYLRLIGSGGLRRDIPLALQLLRNAAAGGSGSAMHNLSYMYIAGDGVGKDEKRGLIWRVLAVENSFAPAMADMGWRHLNGYAVEKNPLKGMKLIERAHQLGGLYGTTYLARLYAMGLGKKKDPKKSRALFLTAANAGHIPAQYELGWRLMNGDGLAPDTRTGRKWLEKAKANGSAAAAKFLKKK